ELSPEQREYAEILDTSCEHLLNILNDVLDFSKIEAGRMPLDRVGLHLDKVIENAVSLVQPRAATKKLPLTVRIDPAVPLHVTGDPGRIRQVLLNLLGNAVKFTASGGVNLDVSVLSSTSAGAVVMFTVRDTGIGINAAKLPHLFEPFTQADASTTRRYGGTGLGLAISRRLVELMGGGISVESREGEGATFRFTLPLLNAAPSSDSPEEMEGLRALLVEGQSGSLSPLETNLRSAGLETSTSEPPAAMEQLLAASREGTPFHFALIDANCPAGTRLMREIATFTELGDLALIACRTSAAVAAKDAPFDASLSPTLPPEALASLLAAAREHKRGSTGPTQVSPVCGPTLHVLLVEDNRINQIVAVRLLERLNCEVDIAANGLEAVSMWRSREYDAVFMDCLMPVMDGYQATREIRLREIQDPGRRRVPIFAFTANATLNDRDRCFQCGMDDFIAKPIQVQSLRAALDTWVREPRLAAAATSNRL
ncbi:MAG: ATP-binding protein, partial [Bryobacteraceae bacterium]|nr:ATP-binding protein [Bryobacteraceae bacterium]